MSNTTHDTKCERQKLMSSLGRRINLTSEESAVLREGVKVQVCFCLDRGLRGMGYEPTMPEIVSRSRTVLDWLLKERRSELLPPIMGRNEARVAEGKKLLSAMRMGEGEGEVIRIDFRNRRRL